MDDNVEDCPVCLTTFDDTLRRLRTLPCGHTFCTPCIEGLILKAQGVVTCPTCRVRHALFEVGQLPICYAIEGLIRRLRGVTLASLPPKPGKDTTRSTDLPVTGPAKKGTTGLSRVVQSMLQEQELKVLAAIHACQEVQAQLDQYQTTLAGWDDCQQQLEDELQALVDKSKSARILMHQEEAQVAAKKEEVHQGEKQLQTLLQALRTAATRLEAYEAIDDADHCSKEETQRVEECLGMFPDVDTITTITKVRETSRAALEAAITAQAAQETAGTPAAAGDSGPSAPSAYSITDKLEALPAPASSITDKLEALLAPAFKSCSYLPPHSLQVEDLRRLTQPARNLLQAGLVFAVYQVEGQSRHARISLQDGCQYVHSLQDQAPPPGAVTVQMSEVVPATFPCLVFMDMAWPGSAPRRVLIRLSSDIQRGKQFLLLCTGQEGPSYTNTSLFKVERKGQPGEYVSGGDYEYGDGSGGAGLLPCLSQGTYHGSYPVGAVWALCGSASAQDAQFCITTRDLEKGTGYFLGEVVEGLEVVVAAAKHCPITQVTVVECGVVLWKE